VRGLDAAGGANNYAFTGAAAASLSGPFVDVDPVDLFVGSEQVTERLRTSISGRGLGPELRAIRPYDVGVFMYARVSGGIPVISDIQAYLDLFARGGRDLTQAEYLLEKRIAPAWVRR
jgi:hypothetical protein